MRTFPTRIPNLWTILLNSHRLIGQRPTAYLKSLESRFCRVDGNRGRPSCPSTGICSYGSFDQTEASVFSAKTIRGDVDIAGQVHHRRMADSLHHRGGVARIPNLETTQAKALARKVETKMPGSSRFHCRLERWHAHALSYCHEMTRQQMTSVAIHLTRICQFGRLVIRLGRRRWVRGFQKANGTAVAIAHGDGRMVE
jgi:hypothetical protein